MKVAWLVWRDADDPYPILVPEADSELDYAYRKVRIVYTEVKEE